MAAKASPTALIVASRPTFRRENKTKPV